MHVPPELATLRQWMLWSDEYGTKVPYQTNGRRAKSNDPSTWNTLDECLANTSGRSGVAFCFAADDPFCGVDLDDCIENGVLLDWAQEIVDRFRGVAWIEYSPSGTGIKITTKATKPDASRCSNNKGVECYDRLRYWTWTGNTLGEGCQEIGDGQEAVEWLISKHLPAPVRQTGAVKIETTRPAPLELLQRAEAYIDACRPGKKGNLRNSAFQNAGHLHAMIGTDGSRLSDADVFNLLKRWNLRNTDQLRDDELQEAAVNGRKNGTPPADKPPSVAPLAVADDSDVDLSGILGEIIESTPPDVPFSPGDFPREAIPSNGIIGQIVEYNLRTAMYPQPELALSGALALMSVIIGRKVETEHGTRSNLYILGLGESGSGKEHARKINKDLLQAAGADSMLGPERIGSSAGLTVAVQERLAALFQIDEIGHLLATMKNPGKAAHLYNIGTVLMQMYSSADTLWKGDAYADSKRTPEIDQPHAVVYGTCTPDGFWQSLTSDNVSNGLLGRMLVFEAPGYVGMRYPEPKEIPSHLLESIAWWVSFFPGGIDKSKSRPVKVIHTTEAMDRYRDHLAGIAKRRQKEGKDQASVWSRTGEKTAKLALIFACSRQQYSPSIRIELDDVERSIKISNWLTRRMLRQAYDYVSANYVEENSKRLLRLIVDKMCMTELCRKTRWLKSRERFEILSDLQDQQLIEVVEEPTRGRTKRFVRRLA